jgi:hypothetical protein
MIYGSPCVAVRYSINEDRFRNFVYRRIRLVKNIKIVGVMYQDISCGTDPIDESKIETELVPRWFAGLSQSFVTRVNDIPADERFNNLVQGDRKVQRVEEVEGGAASIHIDIDPTHILPEDGMLFPF